METTNKTTECSHGTPKSKRCEQCVLEGVYTYAQPREALTITLNDVGQMFAGVATIRAAVFDVLDSRGWAFGGIVREGGVVLSEDGEDEQRALFTNAVIARIAELQAVPHDGVRLENLCDKHKRLALPVPTAMVCVQCEKERANVKKG